MVRETTAWLLADAGHAVHEAVDGQDALDFLDEQGPVDLVITDINMPRLDGLAFRRQAKSRWPGLPILLISGRPQPPGLPSFMAKPFRWEALMAAIARMTVPDQPAHIN